MVHPTNNPIYKYYKLFYLYYGRSPMNNSLDALLQQRDSDCSQFIQSWKHLSKK